MLMLIEVVILLHSLIMLMLLVLFFAITLRKSIVNVFALIRFVVIKEHIRLGIMLRDNNRMLTEVVPLERQYQLGHSDVVTISAAISVIRWRDVILVNIVNISIKVRTCKCLICICPLL
jgi:hypothetical protein